jgi:hypothetical protein
MLTLERYDSNDYNVNFYLYLKKIEDLRINLLRNLYFFIFKISLLRFFIDFIFRHYLSNH